MDKKSILVTAGIVFGIVALMLWGRGSQTAEVAQSPASSEDHGHTAIASQNFGATDSLTAPEKLYDFGTISMKNGLVDHVFKVTNSSDRDIYITKVSTSCMSTNAYIESAGGKKGPFGMEGHGGRIPPANETIKAGESIDVRVVYDPNAHGPAGVGVIDRLVYLTDAAGNTFQLGIKATVTP